MVQDIDRPDVDGVEPKMQHVAERAALIVGGLAPVLRVSTDDNFCSSVMIRGSLDARSEWSNGIFENSRYFRFSIGPAKGQRYWNGEDKVTVSLPFCASELHKKYPFRKSTTTVEKAIERIRKWLLGVDVIETLDAELGETVAQLEEQIANRE